MLHQIEFKWKNKISVKACDMTDITVPLDSLAVIQDLLKKQIQNWSLCLLTETSSKLFLVLFYHLMSAMVPLSTGLERQGSSFPSSCSTGTGILEFVELIFQMGTGRKLKNMNIIYKIFQYIFSRFR